MRSSLARPSARWSRSMPSRPRSKRPSRPGCASERGQTSSGPPAAHLATLYWNHMRLFRPCLALMSALLLALPGAAAARASDDTPEEIARELSEKIAKAYKKAAEAQRKAAEKAAKREKEEREDRTEAQLEA